MTQTPEPPAAQDPIPRPTRAVQDPIAAAVAPGYTFEGTALELGGLMLNATDLSDVQHPDPARDAQPPRPRRRRDRHRQDQDPAAPRRAAERQRRAGLRGRHQGRPVRPQRPGRGRREDRGPRHVGGPGVDRDRLPDRVLCPRRPGHRRTHPSDDDVVRPDAPEQGARPQRHPGVEPRPGLPLRRPGRAAAARPGRPAGRGAVPHQRRGQGRPQGSRWPLQRHRRRHPARADLLPGPGRRRVLRRAGVRVEASSSRSPPTARA